MPLGLYVGAKPAWQGSTSLGPFTSGTGGTVNLNSATYIRNPRSQGLAFQRTGSGNDTAPGAVTLSTAGVLTVPTSVTAGSYQVEAQFSSGVTVSARALTVTVSAASGGSALIGWSAPTTNSAGQSFDSSSADRTLTGHRIYYGTSDVQALAGASSSVFVAMPTVSYNVTGLASGTWYFRVCAVDGNGDESLSQALLSKVIP